MMPPALPALHIPQLDYQTYFAVNFPQVASPCVNCAVRSFNCHRRLHPRTGQPVQRCGWCTQQKKSCSLSAHTRAASSQADSVEPARTSILVKDEVKAEKDEGVGLGSELETESAALDEEGEEDDNMDGNQTEDEDEDENSASEGGMEIVFEARRAPVRRIGTKSRSTRPPMVARPGSRDTRRSRKRKGEGKGGSAPGSISTPAPTAAPAPVAAAPPPPPPSPPATAAVGVRPRRAAGRTTSSTMTAPAPTAQPTMRTAEEEEKESLAATSAIELSLMERDELVRRRRNDKNYRREIRQMRLRLTAVEEYLVAMPKFWPVS